MEVDWVRSDVRSHRPPAAAYGLIVELYLHHPADERRAVHAAMATGLRPGGVLLVVGHDVVNLTDGYAGPRDPSALFTADDVAADVAGLSPSNGRSASSAWCRPTTASAGPTTPSCARVRRS